MTFKFVPEYTERIINASLDHLPGWQVVIAEYVGARSATRVVYQVRGIDVEVWLPYDFAIKFPESERGRIAAELVIPPRTVKLDVKLTGEGRELLQKLAGDNPDADGVVVPQDDLDPEPNKPTRNRRKKAVSDSKDGK